MANSTNGVRVAGRTWKGLILGTGVVCVVLSTLVGFAMHDGPACEELRTEIARLRSQLDEQEAEIGGYQAEIATMQARIRTLEVEPGSDVENRPGSPAERGSNEQRFVKAVAECMQSADDQARQCVSCYHTELSGQLAAGNRVSFVDFGSYRVGVRPARTGVHPATGKPIEISASRNVESKGGQETEGPARRGFGGRRCEVMRAVGNVGA